MLARGARCVSNARKAFGFTGAIAKCPVLGCVSKPGFIGTSAVSVPVCHVTRMCLGCTRTGTRLKALARSSLSRSVGLVHSHMKVPRLSGSTMGTSPSPFLASRLCKCGGISGNPGGKIVLRVHQRHSVRVMDRNVHFTSLYH